MPEMIVNTNRLAEQCRMNALSFENSTPSDKIMAKIRSWTEDD